MKRKLTSLAMAIVLTVSLSIPAFAAEGRQGGCPDDLNALVRQLLRQCGGCGGQEGAQNCPQNDLNALLWALLMQQSGAPAQNETPKPTENGCPLSQQPDKPAQGGKPTETGTPAQGGKPTEAGTPSQSGKPAQEKPKESEAQQPELDRPAQTDTSIAYEQEVVRLVNAERAKAGLSPLAVDAALTRTARMKSQDMHNKGYFDHQSPTYGSPFDLMKAQGVRYRTAGENIAMGYRTPETVVAAWMASPGHKANILNASYTKIGVGYVASGSYWTQHFTG